MATVHIRINSRDYEIACDDGQEDHLRKLADEVDSRIRALVRSMGANPGDSFALALTALTMADELIENKKENAKIAAEVKRLGYLVNEDRRQEQDGRMQDIENAMAVTLEEIALRIEKIAQTIEVG